MIQRIETSEQFAELRSEWNALLESTPSRTMFLTHEWLSAWWEHLGRDRELFILTWRKENRLAAILPFVVSPPDVSRLMPRRLEFIGSGIIGSDYLDAIIRPDVQTQALGEFCEYLEQSGLLLQLSQLRLGNCVAEALARELGNRGWTVSRHATNVCPYIDLSQKTWESYLADLSSSHKYNFQRRLKNLSKLRGFRVECARAGADALRALDVLIQLHQKRWESRGQQSEAFQTDVVRNFHRALAPLAAERDWLRVFTMWVDERPVAALYGFRYGNVFSFYQSGFDPEFSKQSVGLVMMGLAIQAAMHEGCQEYDFLHGREEYKFHWTQEARNLGQLEMFPSHARAQLCRQAIGLNRAARRMAKRVLGMV